MTINSNAAIFQFGTQQTVISESSPILNGAFNAGTVTPLAPADPVPFADLVLGITFSSTPSASGAIHVYRRDLNIDGSNSAPVPDNQFKQIHVGTFVPDLVTTQQFLSLPSVPISTDQEFYIENLAGSETVGTTTLKATPKTFNGKG